MPSDIPIPITIANEPIRLGQFLKFSNLAQDGFEAKMHIQNGAIRVNGVVETRRGKKLVHGDQITMGKTHYLIACPKEREREESPTG
jgi:ribosome-associated protein